MWPKICLIWSRTRTKGLIYVNFLVQETVFKVRGVVQETRAQICTCVTNIYRRLVGYRSVQAAFSTGQTGPLPQYAGDNYFQNISRLFLFQHHGQYSHTTEFDKTLETALSNLFLQCLQKYYNSMEEVHLF